MLEDATTVDRSLGSARDFDVREDDSWVGLFERSDGLYVADSHGHSFPLGQRVRYPILRAVGFDRVVVADARPVPTTPGGLVISLSGQTLCSFSVGDGIQDLLVLDDAIVVTYFDEGVFGGTAPSEQGLAFFDLQGTLLGGYQSVFGAEAVDVADCYAACVLGRNRVAFSAYTGFELVLLNPRARVQDVHPLPKELHGASALSMRGEDAYLYGPYGHKRGVFCWRSGSAPRFLGEHSGPLRGLRAGRFLLKGEHGFTVLDCAAAG